MSDGKAYDIVHPAGVFLTPRSMAMGAPIRKGVRVYGRVHYCALLHVVRVEMLDGNGRRRERPAS
jgi:hypothetical protein